MVTRSSLSFQLKRTQGVLKAILKNKMALVGLVILIGFLFTATAAPLLTPYSPSQKTSGSLAQPAWVTQFPEGYYLSKNIVVVDDPLFKSPAAIQSWDLATGLNASLGSNLSFSYAPGVRTPPGGGSMQLDYAGSGQGRAVLSRSFTFPYHGPPKEFEIVLSYLAAGASKDQPVHVRLFIDRVRDQTFNILDTNVTGSGYWYGLRSLSNEESVEKTLGITHKSGFDPAEVIFSRVQSYSLEVELTFNGPQRVNLSNFQLTLFGTASGLLGTDLRGADLFTLVVYGSRVSLFVGLLAAFIGISLGLLVGLMAGFLGRIVDETLMRFTDMLLVIPALPLLLVLIGVIGASLINVIFIIGFLGWMGFARIVRSQVLSLKERPFIEAAKAAGAGPVRIISRHVFPNIVSLTYVNLALAVPGAILTESALSFIGLGDPTVTSWGNIYYQAEVAGALSLKPPPWWWLIPPGLAIALISLSFILIGYAMDEIFNPKLRRRR